MKTPRIGVAYCLHDDHWFLQPSMESLKEVGDVILFVSTVAWNKTVGRIDEVLELARSADVEVVLGRWETENEHRQASLAELKVRGYTHAFTPDGDEIFQRSLRDHIVQSAVWDIADVVRCTFDTYWKTTEHVIRPRERIRPVVFLNVQRAQHLHLRDYVGDRLIVLEAEFGVVHHFSYSGPPERIQRKLETFSHSHEIVPDWFDNVWLGWDANPQMENLHPTHPAAYQRVERVVADGVLKTAP